MREQMEEHRANPVVRQLPQADGPARLRARELRRASARGATTRRRRRRSTRRAQLADGTQRRRRRRAAAGAAEAARTCSSATLTEKLLTYALGRGLEYYDMPAVRDDRARRRREQTTASRRLVLGIVKSAPFQMRMKATRAGRSMRRECDDVHHQEVAAPPDVPARHGRHAGAAAARRHGAGLARRRADRRRPGTPLRRRLRAARRSSWSSWTPDADGRRLRVHADPEAARAASATTWCVVSGLDGAPDGGSGGHATAPGRVADRRLAEDRPKAPTSTRRRRSTRSSRGRSARTRRSRRSKLATEDFTGSVGACDTGYSCAYMNTISLAGADDAAADGDQPARRVRADVRRHRHRRASASRACRTDRSILDSVRTKSARAAERARAARPRAADRVPRRRPRDRAPHPDVRAAERAELTAPDAPVGVPERLRRARRPDVRPAWRWRSRPTSRASSRS